MRACCPPTECHSPVTNQRFVTEGELRQIGLQVAGVEDLFVPSFLKSSFAEDVGSYVFREEPRCLRSVGDGTIDNNGLWVDDWKFPKNRLQEGTLVFERVLSSVSL